MEFLTSQVTPMSSQSSAYPLHSHLDGETSSSWAVWRDSILTGVRVIPTLYCRHLERRNSGVFALWMPSTGRVPINASEVIGESQSNEVGQWESLQVQGRRNWFLHQGGNGKGILNSGCSLGSPVELKTPPIQLPAPF